MRKILLKVPVFFKLLPIYIVLGVLVSVPFIQNKNERLRIERDKTIAETRLREAPVEKVILKKLIQGHPSRILIPSVGVDLSIIDGTYDSTQKRWLVIGDKINYVSSTPYVNNKSGNTIMYGHYYKWVLGKTSDLKLGDKMYVYSRNDKIFEYRFIKSQVVKPTDTDIFAKPSSEPMISLITCEGQWAQARRIMYFKFTKVA